MPETSDMLNMRTSMPRTLKDNLEALKPKRREAVEAEADRLHAQYRLQVQTTDTK
jgi:hypothetical protein